MALQGRGRVMRGYLLPCHCRGGPCTALGCRDPALQLSATGTQQGRGILRGPALQRPAQGVGWRSLDPPPEWRLEGLMRSIAEMRPADANHDIRTVVPIGRRRLCDAGGLRLNETDCV